MNSILKKTFLAAAVLLAGCKAAPTYKEGTMVSLGAYVPWEGGQMYGVEIAQYINGVVVRTPTNMLYEVSRSHSVTNDWLWGALKCVESSETTVRFTGKAK